MEDLVSSLKCTHLILAQPGDHAPDVRLKADDAQLVQLRECDLSLTQKVKCCKRVKRVGVVDHVLPEWLPHADL